MLSVALLLRTALVLATSWSLHVTCTPPHPSPPPSAQHEAQDTQERLFVRSALAVKHPTWLAHTLLWFAALSELRLAFTHPSTHTLPIDGMMLLGCTAAVLGGMTRARCYALLGARFTFELAAHGARQPELVSTGPYALVRHPSYSAACLAFYGACAVFLSPRSAIRLSLRCRLYGG